MDGALTDSPPRRFRARDGVELAWREAGDGRPVVLLHGLMGSGALLLGGCLRRRPWPGRATGSSRPDLRGHGDSGRPHDPAWPPQDVLAVNALALIDHLGLGDYHLAGYSLGGKLVLRLPARGARRARAIVGGQGLDALGAESDRTDGYRRLLAAVASGAAFEPGSPEEGMAGWVKQTGVDPQAVTLLLGTMPRDAAGRAAPGHGARAGGGGRAGQPERVRRRAHRPAAERAACPGPRRSPHRPRRPGAHRGGP